MKSNKLPGLFIILILFVVSCSKNDDTPDYSYFVSKEKAVTLTQVYINSMMNSVSGSIPEISSLKPLVKSDVDIYRVVYKTTLSDKDVNVSGLVCVPTVAGDYPVISFQNGTNTLNALAPSVNPLNYSYQLIEVLASMGYIVVIADYPGFGESSTITHPYLVAQPTVQSLVDLLFTVKEMQGFELPGISVKNAYYLLGYSQGGWATLALHKSLELSHSADFNLVGSACGAGPYNITLLFDAMVNVSTYPMPSYIGYIIKAYTSYNQFTNPVSDILKEPYATRLSTLYNGTLGLDDINMQLTTSVPDLYTSDFISGFSSNAKYSGIRDAMRNNSVSAWKTNIPLMLIHGGNDTQVNPVSTENMYSAMIQAGTSPGLITKVIVPGVDHSDGAVPCMLQSIFFLQELSSLR